MSINEDRAVDLLARLAEDRPNTLAGVSYDEHGNFCLYCGVRGWNNRPREPALRPDHRPDCPIEQGQRLLSRIYGDEEAR